MNSNIALENNISFEKRSQTTLFFLITYIVFVYFNPVFKILPNELSVIPYFLISCYLFFRADGIKKIKPQFFFFISLFALATISHAIYYPLSVFADLNLMMMLTASYFLITTYRIEFFHTLLKFIYFSATFSLVLWPIIIFIDYFVFDVFSILESAAINYRDEDIGLGERFSLVFINWEDSYRNFGLFYEPAYAAQIYITGLILYEIFKNFGYKISNKYLYVFYLAIFFTQSTGGYILVFAHMLLFMVRLNGGRFIYLVPLILLALFLLNSFGFLGTKIISRFSGATDSSNFHYYNGRVNIFFYIFLYLKNPLFGFGSYLPILNYIDVAQGIRSASIWNGYFSFLISYGGVIFLAYNYFLWQACKSLNFNKINIWTLKLFLFVILASNASDHSLSPFFYILPLWGFIMKEEVLARKV